ncbi:hypothetical protein ACQ5SP_06705 [Rhodovulum sp. YNF3179]|uniref:hypothetical protein n=1 Tax=Rhodovulum sp. YNF3179 TaxID=3425127 RepID=UPI003D3292DA
MIFKDLPRQTRRKIKQQADSIGLWVAKTTVSRDQSGQLAAIEDPNALRALQRGFAALVRNDFEPVALRLTESEAAALDAEGHAIPGADCWAGFGLDVDGRASWVTLYACGVGMSVEDEAVNAETLTLERLAAHCNTSGLPDGGFTA